MNELSVLNQLASSDKLTQELSNMNVNPHKLMRCFSLYIKSLDETRANKLMSCTKESIQNCMLDCARMGLYPSGRGNIYLIPYGTKCTIMVGYLGMEELAVRQEHVSQVISRIVYEDDEFVINYGTTDEIVHRPKLVANNTTVTHAYAIIKFTNGTHQFEVMNKEQLLRAKNCSKSPDSPAWKNWVDEMFKKVVIKRLLKHIPYDDKLEKAIAIDNRDYKTAVMETDAIDSEAELLNEMEEEK